VVSDQSFGHLNEVERDSYPMSAGGFFDAGGLEADVSIEVPKLGAVVDEAELHFPEAGGAAMIFYGGHEFCAESGLLAGRVDGDEAEMSTLAARLDKGTGDRFAVFFEEQEFSAVENFAKRVGVDALAFDVGTLGDKGGIDEADESGDVFGTREAEDRGHGDILRGIVVRVSEEKSSRFPLDCFAHASE
jgi:hypothetical protein